MHHTRKRKIAEQNYSLPQDEAIGSSVFNHLVAVLIGVDPQKEDVDEEKGSDTEDENPINLGKR